MKFKLISMKFVKVLLKFHIRWPHIIWVLILSKFNSLDAIILFVSWLKSFGRSWGLIELIYTQNAFCDVDLETLMKIHLNWSQIVSFDMFWYFGNIDIINFMNGGHLDVITVSRLWFTCKILHNWPSPLINC